MVTWGTTADGERRRSGLVGLGCPLLLDDPSNTESRAGTKHVIDTLAAPDSGSIVRAKTAIAMHLASGGQPAPLASYRASTPSARRNEAPAARHSTAALFALERAPEPEPADERSAAEGHGWGTGRRLRARHHVRAHWKRQAFGPKLSRRRWIVVEGYARGPVPREDQIVMTRLNDERPTQPGRAAECTEAPVPRPANQSRSSRTTHR